MVPPTPRPWEDRRATLGMSWDGVVPSGVLRRPLGSAVRLIRRTDWCWSRAPVWVYCQNTFKNYALFCRKKYVFFVAKILLKKTRSLKMYFPKHVSGACWDSWVVDSDVLSGNTPDGATLSQNIPSVARRSSEGRGVGGTTQDGSLCPDPDQFFLCHRVDNLLLCGNHLTDFSELKILSGFDVHLLNWRTPFAWEASHARHSPCF